MRRKVSDVIFGRGRAWKGLILLEMKKGEVTAQELIMKLGKA